MKLIYKVIVKLENAIKNHKVKALKMRFKFCGSNVIIYSTCEIIVPEQFEIGNNTSISAYTTIYATFGVRIGNNCLISSNCGISSYNHIQNSENRRQDEKFDHLHSKPVKIGNNVWIGMNSCILPGVEIGDNSIIGSGSVVTKNIPPNEIWVGNPAKFKRKITL